jgi:hypothetical protein
MLDQESGAWPVLAGGVLIGTGVAYGATPARDAIVVALPGAKQGVALALNDVTGELGAVLCIAILWSVFNATYRGTLGTPPRSWPPNPRRVGARLAECRLQVAQPLGAG